MELTIFELNFQSYLNLNLITFILFIVRKDAAREINERKMER